MKLRSLRLALAGLFILAASAIASAQVQNGVRYDNVALLDTGRPAGAASIHVCSAGSSGTPCSPVASIFTDQALTSAITGAIITADARGNYGFYAACGQYDIQISGSGLTTATFKNVQLGPCGTYLAKFDATGQSANIAGTTIYSPAPQGLYRASCEIVLTRAATTSSTLPACSIFWTDADSSIAQASLVSNTSTANTVGFVGIQNYVVANIAAGGGFSVATAGYASTGATSMQFAIHLKLEFIGK